MRDSANISQVKYKRSHEVSLRVVSKGRVDAENDSSSNTQCGWVVRLGSVSRSDVCHLQNGEAPRNEGDTGVVSAVGTPMLKSARILKSRWRGRALARLE